VVTSRIDRLSPPEQLTLKVASVIGRTFSLDLLRDVCPIEVDKSLLKRHLTMLVRQNLTMLDSQDADLVYSFKHVITQEVAYRMMPPAQRKLLHQAVAEWYETHHRADLSSFFPLLAKHWCNTDQVDKTIAYLEKSGENAMRDFAHEEAVSFFSQALDLDRQSGLRCERFRRACWERQLAEAHYNLGAVTPALEHFQIALELFGYPLPRTHSGLVLSTVWEIAKQMVHRLLPGLFFGRARHDKAVLLEVARAYERLVQVYYLNNAKVPTMHAAFRSLNLTETVGECPELARNYAHATVFCGLLMLHGQARAHAQRARAMAERVNQPPCTAYVCLIRGIYWVTVGEWETGEEDQVHAIQIAERIGEKRRWYEGTFTLVKLLSRKGDFRRSAALSAELHQSATRRGIPQVQVWGLSWHIWCLLALDPDSPQLVQLENALDACLGANRSIPLGDQILGQGLLSLSRWRRGATELASQATEPAEQIINKTNPVGHHILSAYAGLAEVYMGLWALHRGDGALEREMQRRIRKLFKALSQFCLMYPVGRPETGLVRGCYYWLRGKRWRARRAWKKSLAAAQRYRMPLEEARARLELAQHSSADDPERAGHLQRAGELFTEIGATYYLRQLEKLIIEAEVNGRKSAK
jgi:tetratricopeptide (TPR) repeat protein